MVYPYNQFILYSTHIKVVFSSFHGGDDLERYRRDGYEGYRDSVRLPSGQTALIEFFEDRGKDRIYYGIHFVVFSKRKHIAYTDLKITGKDGLKALIWAKRKIEEFEDFITKEKLGMPITIYCQWTDSRRRDAYHYGLSKIGFRYGRIDEFKALIKRI